MTDAIRQFRKYLEVHDRLIQEVRLPSLDPGTDRAYDERRDRELVER